MSSGYIVLVRLSERQFSVVRPSIIYKSWLSTFAQLPPFSYKIPGSSCSCSCYCSHINGCFGKKTFFTSVNLSAVSFMMIFYFWNMEEVLDYTCTKFWLTGHYVLGKSFCNVASLSCRDIQYLFCFLLTMNMPSLCFTQNQRKGGATKQQFIYALENSGLKTSVAPPSSTNTCTPL